MRLSVQIQENDNGYNRVKIKTNDRELLEDALRAVRGTDTGTYGVDTSQPLKIKTVLRELFDKHTDFYNAFGFDAGTEHGPTGQDFNTRGWRKFCRQNFNRNYLGQIDDEEGLQLFCDVIAERLGEILEEYNDELVDDDQNFVTRSTVSVDSGSPERLNDPELLDEAVVTTGDSAFKLNIEEVEDAETFEDVKKNVESNTKQVFRNQMQARLKTYKTRVENLENKIEQERRDMLVKGIQMVDELDNWEVEDGYLVYQDTVHLQTAQKKSTQGDPKELTEEAKEKFYIDGLKVKVMNKIKSPTYEDAYHPHALSTGMCSGSFRTELSKEGLQEVVEQMRQADLHNSNHTNAERELKENFDEYIKTDEDGNEETEEVWEA